MNLRVQGKVFLLVTTNKPHRAAWAGSRMTSPRFVLMAKFCVNCSAELQTAGESRMYFDSLEILRRYVYLLPVIYS